MGRYACQVVTSAVVVLMSTSIYNFICANLDRWCHHHHTVFYFAHYTNVGLINICFLLRLVAIKYPLEYRQDDMSWWSSRTTLKVNF